MKYLIHTIALIMLLLFAACGDFYVFENEPDSWDGVTMRVLCDSNYVMEGDSMPLLVDFSPINPDATDNLITSTFSVLVEFLK